MHELGHFSSSMGIFLGHGETGKVRGDLFGSIQRKTSLHRVYSVRLRSAAFL